jgi:NAD(P)-dependent dehydrogenase (short-subunit alcohol dehydrogenase family)
MKTVLITGATSGIGQQLAKDYDAAGWQVIACGRNSEKLATLTAGTSMQTLEFDLMKSDEIAAAGEQIKNELDMVILCAGTCEYIDDVMQFDNAMFRRVMTSNVLGMGDCLAAFLHHIPRGGQIALVGSSASFFPFTRAQAYGSSKAAVSYLARSLAVDLAPHGVDVSLVSPGFIETPMTDKNDFEMPMKISVEKAATDIKQGLDKRKAHIGTPRVFTFLLGLLSQLPHSVQVWLGQKMVKS